jgi:hypothetical protein
LTFRPQKKLEVLVQLRFYAIFLERNGDAAIRNAAKCAVSGVALNALLASQENCSIKSRSLSNRTGSGSRPSKPAFFARSPISGDSEELSATKDIPLSSGSARMRRAVSCTSMKGIAISRNTSLGVNSLRSKQGVKRYARNSTFSGVVDCCDGKFALVAVPLQEYCVEPKLNEDLELLLRPQIKNFPLFR